MDVEFRFEAVNSSGGTVDGIIQGQTEQHALEQLRAQGLTPTLLELRNKAPVNVSKRATGRISTVDKILLIRELATLLRAGIALADAVYALSQARAGTPLGVAFDQTWRSLNAGQNFVSALAESKVVFPPYVSQLAATGEMTGKLAATMADAAKQMEYDEKVRQEMINALIYPSILVTAGLGAILLIFIVVVPKFANLVKNARATDVPELSLWVINAGVFFNAHWVMLASGVAIALLLLILSIRDDAGRTRWLARLSGLPLIGPWLREAEIGRWASTLGTLLGNRVPILSALELSANGLRLPQIRRQLDLVIRDVRAGAALADAAAKHAVVGATGINLIRVGEKSGELPQMVSTLGELHADAGRNRMRRFLALLEPAAILVIGAVIGFIMVAIMLAITSLNNLHG
jgi:general secretion pathway protein F